MPAFLAACFLPPFFPPALGFLTFLAGAAAAGAPGAAAAFGALFLIALEALFPPLALVAFFETLPFAIRRVKSLKIEVKYEKLWHHHP